MDTHRNQLVFFTCTLCFIFVGLDGLHKNLLAQSAPDSTRPFIGFRPFGEPATASAAGVRNPNETFRSNERFQRDFQNTPAGSTNTQPNDANARSVYPYPAGPNIGSFTANSGSAPERATINNRLTGSRVPTGGLNRGLGQATMPLVGMDPALTRRYQQEIQQRQAVQLQNQQAQFWRQQQQQQQQQQRFARQNVPSSQQPTLASRPEQSNVPARAQPSSINFQTEPKLNQAVVQQVSSTSTSTRDTRVARANFDSQLASASGRFRPANTHSANNTVAKPQACCVPVNCCQPAVAAQAFRPQAANQIPSLNPSAPTGGSYGFLGQNGAGYQAQAQSGYQFQPGLGVPQFASTGSFGNGGWFSNLVRGTGAYRPLIPLEPLYPNARPGRGIIGQPTAYVDGQPIRNLLRYLMP